jgi:hypothetical protein
MSAITAATDELTPAAVWQGVGGGAIGDALLDWPSAALAAADAGAPWRAVAGIAEPFALLGDAIGQMTRCVRSAMAADPRAPGKALLRDLRRGWGNPGIDRLVRRTLRTAVEQRLARVTSVPVTRG